MSERKSDKMATWPIGKLLFSMSVPAVFSMMIQALYNIVDTKFVSMLGEKAMFAIGIAYPLQMIVLAVGLGGAAGIGTMVARRLGEKRFDEANKVASFGFVLTLIHYLIIAVCGLIFIKPFLGMFTDDPTAISLGYQYLIIVMGLSFGQMFSLLGERILQSTGNMIVPMIGVLIGAITNIILDPIMIFGYFGLPAMGITGAAVATVIGQILGCAFVLIVLLNGKHEEVHIKLSLNLFSKDRVKAVYEVGLPVMIMNALGSVTTTALNSVLVMFSETAVTALAIYFKIQSFVFMPVFGFNQGSLPILSYNYGSKNKVRYLQTIKLYLLIAVVWMSFGMVVFLTQTDGLLLAFNPTNELLQVGNVAFKTISLSFVFAGITIVISAVLQSLSMGFSSMMIQVLRQLGFLIPLAFVLGRLFGLNELWFAYPISEILVVLIFTPICISRVNKAFK